MIKLKLLRLQFRPDRTLGVLVTPNNVFASLELCWKNNEKNVSCIPEGTYQCVRHWSRKFPYMHLMLMNIPNRSGILIHAGNGPESTSGCVLIARGFTSDKGLTATSRASIDQLMEELEGEDDIYLEVDNVS